MPHDQMKLEIAATIDAQIAAKEHEIAELRALREHVLQFGSKPAGQTDLFGQGARQKPQTNGKPRPGLKVGVPSAKSNRGLFRAVLRDSGKAMNAAQVWAEAVKRGAATTMANPLQITSASLTAMRGKGVRRVSKGKYAYDPVTAPSEEDAAVGEVVVMT